MKKKIIIGVLFVTLACIICACTIIPKKDSTFCITFIDVGQGDSALVECDGHYMLIDGGDKKHGENVYRVLEAEPQPVRHLDILAVSHFHTDHYAGLISALANVSKIDLAISNMDTYDNGVGIDEDAEEEDPKAERKLFSNFTHALSSAGASLKVPQNGDKYELGSAIVEVLDVSDVHDNDSLVLLITYGKTKFLFTGDIEEKAQKRIYEKYQDKDGVDKGYKLNLVKMPHHGSYTGTLFGFFRTFRPDYVVISVGQGNRYGHPDQDTLDLFSNPKSGWKPKRVYRTDQDGDIKVVSNGKKVKITTSPNK